MTNLTPADIDRLLELEREATPAPWVWWTSNSWRRLNRDDHGIRQSVAEPYVCHDGHPDLSISEEDMALIAAARNLARPLAERVRELEAENARLRFNADAVTIAANEAAAENTRLHAIVRGFLNCPEIAECGPDKDSETDALEREARAALVQKEEQSDA